MKALTRFVCLVLFLCLAAANGYRSHAQSPADVAAKSAAAASTLPPANLVYGTTRYFNQLTRLIKFAAADINRDGLLDLVAPQFEKSNIAISFGDAANPGTFLAPMFVPTKSPTVDSVTVADLNGDGIPDLIYGDTDSHLAAVLLQNALKPGTFLPAYYVGASQAKPLVADMDRDGTPDLILVSNDAYPYTITNVAILLGDPAHRGSFLAPALFALAGNDIRSVAVADMNADGLPDIAVGNYNAQTVSVFINDSAHPGTLLPRHDYAAGASIFDLAVGDLNHDGYPDIVLGGVSSGVGVLLGNASQPGTLLPVTTYPVTATPSGGISLGIALGDVNGDGQTDVVSGNAGSSFDLLLGKGDGTFASPISYATGPTPDTFEGDSMAVGDVDGDGLQDVMVGQFYQNSVQIFPHRAPLPSLAITATDQSLSKTVVNPGDPLTITIKVSAFQGTPQGTVTLYDSAGSATYIPVATLTLDSTGSAVYTTTSLQPVFHSFVAHFPGDSVYAPSTSLINTVVVTGNPTVALALMGTPNPATLGQTVSLTATITANNPAPTGSVAFLDSGTMLGSAPLNASGVAVFNTSSLVLGVHTLSAVYLGDGHYVSQQASTTEIIRYPAAQLTLASSLNPATLGQSITLQAKASAAGPVPSGTMSFRDNGVLLFSAPLTADGNAALTTSVLAAGNHSIQAIYSGDANYDSQSAMLTEVVLAPASPPPPIPADYTLATGPPLTLSTQRTGTVTLTATPLNGLADTIALSCGSLPLYVACHVVPSSLTLANGVPKQAAVQIALDQYPGGNRLQPAAHVLFIAAFPLLCLALPLRRRNQLRLAASLLALACLPALAGCGYGKLPLVTPPGTYTITINGHGAGSNLNRSTILTLIVE